MALSPGAVQTLLLWEDSPTLASILGYHVVTEPKFSSQVLAQPTIDTPDDQGVDASAVAGRPRIDSTPLILTDIVCSSGIIHVLDAVLTPDLNDVPRTPAVMGGFSTLRTAVTSANLAMALPGPGPITVADGRSVRAAARHVPSAAGRHPAAREHPDLPRRPLAHVRRPDHEQPDRADAVRRYSWPSGATVSA